MRGSLCAKDKREHQPRLIGGLVKIFYDAACLGNHHLSARVDGTDIVHPFERHQQDTLGLTGDGRPGQPGIATKRDDWRLRLGAGLHDRGNGAGTVGPDDIERM